MKTIVFSDTHLTDQFEPRKFEYLAKIIDESDKVVINGDFWDAYYTDFDKFVKSDWKLLFPLLKSKQAIYLYGNHDDPKMAKMDDRVNLFSDKQKKSVKVKSEGKKFHIEHGHRFYPEFEKKRMWMRDYQLYKYYFSSIWDIFDGAACKVFNNSIPARVINEKVKLLINKFKKRNQYFVMGHSHYSEIDKKRKYINTGVNRYGLGNYLLIEKKKFKLINTYY